MSGGGKNQTSTTKVTIPPEVLAQYKKATDMASTAADRPWQSYSSDPSAFVAGMTPTQMAGVGNINANAQAAQPWYQGAGGATVAGMGSANLGGLNVDQYMSPYLRNVAQTTSDLLGQQNEQAMSGQLGNAITAGAGWGDRSGIAAANLNRQQAMSSANILSNLLNQGYTQAQGVAQQQQGADLAARQANLARLMQGGMNLGQLGSAAQEAALQGGQAQMAAGQQEQQTEQARLSAMYNQWLQQQAYPFQTAQFFSNIAQGIGANSGSTTSLTQPAGFFSGLARGGRAGKADGGGLGMASMGGHVGMEHAMQGYADGGMPQDYSAMVLQALFGGGDPNAGAYGMAGGLPGGGAGFVPQPNMQGTVLRPAEMPEPTDQTSVKDVVNAAERGADIYNSEGGQRAGSFIKDLLGYDNPMQQASGGRIGYGLGGTPYESSATSSMGGLPSPGGGYVPPPIDNQSSDKLKPAEIAPQEQESGLGKIADIAKIATMFFLKDGGVAGPRHGYDAGGAPDYSDWRTRIQNDPVVIRDEELTGPQPKPNVGFLPLSGQPRDEYFDPNDVLPVSNAAAKTDNPEASKFDIARDTYANRRKIDEARWALQKVIPGWTTNPVASIADAWSGYYGRTSENAANDANTEKARQTLDWINSNRDYFMMNPDEAAALREDPTGYYDRHKTGLGNANAAPAPALAAPPAGGVAPAAAAPAEQRQIPQVFGEAGMSYTPPLPRPGLAAAAEPTAAGAGPGPAFERAGRGAPGLAAAGVERTLASPVTQEIGVSPKAPPFLADSESGNNFDARNEYGYVGRYQFGEDRLADAKRAGVIPPDMTSEGFRNNKEAQRAVEDWHFNDIDGFINSSGLDRIIGQTINGTPVTRDGMVAVAHLGGKTGLLKFIQSGGGYNPADANGTRLSDYLARGAGQVPANKSQPGTALAGADISAPATSGVPQIRQAAGEAGSGLGRGIGGIGDLFRKNENVLLPILSGIGAMASSPSRYLGSAILQGLGAGAGSYMQRQGQLADIAQTQALTRGVDIANAKASYQPLPNGAAIMWTVQNGQAVPMNAADYFRAQRAGNVIQTLGYVPGQTGGKQTAGAPPAGGAGSSGVAAVQAPQIPMPAGINFGDKSRTAAENETAIANPLAGGPAYETAKKQAETYTSGVQVKAETARRTEQLTNEMATNLANAIIGDGISTAGAGFDVRAQAVGIVNTALRMFGVPEEVSNADTTSTINKKITTLFGAMSAAGVDQTSFSAFSELANAIPNPNMPAPAIASLVASMMVQNARSKAQEYHQRQYGSYSGGLYGGAFAAFNEENPVSNDIQAKDTIAKFMLEAPDLFKHALEGRLTPQQIDEAFEKSYGIPGMSRFFNRGT